MSTTAPISPPPADLPEGDLSQGGAYVIVPGSEASEPKKDPRYEIWDFEKRRQIIRELIVHEDKLTTERTQALYTLQGFLFAALGIIVREGFPLRPGLGWILVIVALTGSLAAALYRQEFLYGTMAVLDLLDDWKKIERDCAGNNPPKVIGYESREATRPRGARLLTRKVVPGTFIVVWLIVLGVMLSFEYFERSGRVPPTGPPQAVRPAGTLQSDPPAAGAAGRRLP
jgi:hypothetical protein